jgi:hypothetical protein
MHTPRILILAAALFSTGAALAQGVAEPQRALSRAEVLADAEIYASSGLRAVEQDDLTPLRGARYQAALARYQALRHAPEFTARVQAIAQRRGEAPTATVLVP